MSSEPRDEIRAAGDVDHGVNQPANPMARRSLASKLPKKLRPLLLNALMLSISVLIAAFVAELAVRLAAPQQLIQIRPDLWQPADTLGWSHRPNVAVEINTGERTVSVFTDDRGFRVGPDGAVEASRKVLLLGDSFMEALQVEHEASTAGLLETELPALMGGPVAVHNTGVGGWDPDQYLIQARTALARDDYEVVLTAVFMGNDVIENQRSAVPPRRPVERYRFRIPRGFSRGAFVNAFLRPLNDMLEVRSHTFILFRNNLETLRMRAGLAPLTFPPQFMADDADSPRWGVTESILLQIHELAVSHGAQPLFVLIPAAFQIDADALESYVEGYGIDPSTIDLDQPNRRLLEAMTTRGLEVVDLLPHFREAHAEGRRLYGSVDRHFTPDGHRHLVDLVRPSIVDALEASDDPAPPPNPAP